MLFRKNVGPRERVFRIAAGLLMVLCGMVALHASPAGIIVAASGAISVLTGIVRYCPACAVAGKQPCDG